MQFAQACTEQFNSAGANRSICFFFRAHLDLWRAHAVNRKQRQELQLCRFHLRAAKCRGTEEGTHLPPTNNVHTAYSC